MPSGPRCLEANACLTLAIVFEALLIGDLDGPRHGLLCSGHIYIDHFASETTDDCTSSHFLVLTRHIQAFLSPITVFAAIGRIAAGTGLSDHCDPSKTHSERIG
jgi:hypothetical protein